MIKRWIRRLIIDAILSDFHNNGPIHQKILQCTDTFPHGHHNFEKCMNPTCFNNPCHNELHYAWREDDWQRRFGNQKIGSAA